MHNPIHSKSLILPITLTIFLIVVSQFNFLLFHTLAESFAIMVAILTAVVAWHMYAYTRNHFLMYLGCGYFWVASLDTIHALAYEGLAIIEMSGANMATQFWVAARYLEAALLLTAPLFLSRTLNRNITFSIYGVISLILCVFIMSGNFPDAFIEAGGLTTFKIYSEYIIITIILFAIIHLTKKKKFIDQRIYLLMTASMILTIMAELSFTFYVSVYGASNIAGHVLKLLSYWLIFISVVRTPLLEPFSAMAKAETYYDAIPDSSIIIDRDGIIKHANKSACLQTNLSSIDLVEKNSHILFHGTQTDQANCHICKEIKNGTEISPYELQIDDSSWVEITTSAISGDPHFVEIIRDITSRKRIEDLMCHSQKMDALGKLTGGIAHDFNNMLGVVLGYADLLAKNLKDMPTLEKYANEIHHAASRGVRLTKKLLSFSKYKLSNEVVTNINDLIIDMQDMLRKTLTARVSLILDLSDCQFPVLIDKNDLEDAIINMAINAMHSMEFGGKLTISTSNITLQHDEANLLQLTPGKYLCLRISDTGCGMNSETKEKLFDPFYSTKGESGTGLGLSQVYGFVERSDAAIKVTSDLGIGTTFSLYFPHYIGSSSNEKIDSLDIATPPNNGDETILIVDDEPELLEIAATVIDQHGYNVMTANSAEEALIILKKCYVDLLFSDIIMPDTGGFELADIVRKQYPKIKIQLTSGFVDEKQLNHENHLLRENALQKPYTFNELLVCIRNNLDKKAPSSIKGKTILIIDDDENIRELFKINLEKIGYNTILVKNSDELIASHEHTLKSGNKIDAVIMDLNIPNNIKTSDIVYKIRKLDPDVKIIVASSHAGSSEMTQYRDHGFDASLEKNFNHAEIKRALKEIFS